MTFAERLPAIVINAGYGDPLPPPEMETIGDTETQGVRELVEALAPGADAVI
jgi:hypothetical protein